MDTADEVDEDLLELLYRCPIGLVELDERASVTRMNPAAVRLLLPLVDAEDLHDLLPLLARIAPGAVRAAASGPARIRPLPPGTRLLVPAGTGWGGTPVTVQLHLDRLGPGRLLLALLDVSADSRLAAREQARALHIQRVLLGLTDPEPHTDLAATGDPAPRPLRVIARALAEFTGADLVAVLLLDPAPPDAPRGAPGATPDGDAPEEATLTVAAVAGDAAPVTVTVGVRVGSAGSAWAQGLRTRAPVGHAAAPTGLPTGTGAPAPAGPLLAVPLVGPAGPLGVVLVARDADRPAFGAAETRRAQVLAGHAVLALELAHAAATRQQLARMEERDRLERALHDQVIQNLFAAGLQVQSLAYASDEPATAARLSAQVDAIDAVIARLRETVSDGSAAALLIPGPPHPWSGG